MEKLETSFRDPAGFVFSHAGTVYRAINEAYLPHYDQLMSSGLYQELVDKGYLVSHKELEDEEVKFPGTCRTLFPEQIKFISYPSEWTFDQLKEAALLTLKIHRLALQKGLILKDATPYNIQFVDNKPIWIDTLSFESYRSGMVWTGYRQFCESFLAPLVLMAEKDLRMNLFRIFPDGTPLDFAVQLLPAKDRFRIGMYMDIFLHSKLQRESRHQKRSGKRLTRPVSVRSLLGHADIMERTINRLGRKKFRKSSWSAYYTDDLNTKKYLVEKSELIDSLLDKTHPDTLIDMGANTGHFSLLAGRKGINVIALEKDPLCANELYRHLAENDIKNVASLVFDIMNPIPPSGWGGLERTPVWQRANADMVMALGLMHHLAIGENVPFDKTAAFLARFAKKLIIEYISPEDNNAAQLLLGKPELKQQYGVDLFLNAFSAIYNIEGSYHILSGKRTVYLMSTKA